MTNGIIAEAFEMDREDLKRRRAQSVRNVKATNGLISLEKYARFRQEQDWNDDEYRLAKELLKGDLIKRNSDAAVEWFARSAERGNPYAQYMLGKLYLAGKEVPHDEEKAAY